MKAAAQSRDDVRKEQNIPSDRGLKKLPPHQQQAAHAVLQAAQQSAQAHAEAQNYRSQIAMLEQEIKAGNLDPATITRLRQQQNAAREGLRIASEAHDEYDQAYDQVVSAWQDSLHAEAA